MSSGPLCWSLERKYGLGSFMLPGFDSHPEQQALTEEQSRPGGVYHCLLHPWFARRFPGIQGD